jgi:hypothetical protein
LLGAIELGTLDVRHVVSLADLHARVVDEQPVQSPSDPGCDALKTRFVVFDLPYHAHGSGYKSPFHRPDLNIHQLPRGRAELTLPPTRQCRAAAAHGSQIHVADREGPRPWPLNVWMYRAGPHLVRVRIVVRDTLTFSVRGIPSLPKGEQDPSGQESDSEQ